MASPYRDAAEFSDAAVASAASLLSRWRNGVAEWAEAPSRPMPAGTGDAVRAAVEDDLDTVAALAILRSVEASDSIPAGARFETFVYADRLLGLDIASEVGRGRS
jgi:cysteinyl-tRNA synthetase